MTEIQILLAMGALVALMLCLIASLFWQRWPNLFWRLLALFWGTVMTIALLFLALLLIIPETELFSLAPENLARWLMGISWGISGAISAHEAGQKRTGQQYQSGMSASGIPGGLPQAHSPYASDYGYADPTEITHAGARTKRGSRRGYSIDGDRPPHPGQPGGIPQPPAPKAPSSDPPRRTMAVKWPLKPSAEAAGMAPGELPPRPRFARAVAAPRLMARLDALTYSRERSERLIAQNLQKNPGRSPDWAADKAIWDIERDRQ